MRIPDLLYLSLLITPPLMAEVYETLTYNTYTARHRSGMSLSETLTEASSIYQGGRMFYGYTSWYVQWSYNFRQSPNGRCEITGSETTLTAEITLPDLESPDDQVRLAFAKYIDALKRHELGHYEIAQKLVRNIDDEIGSMPALDSCLLLERETDVVAKRLLSEAKQEERKYDESTQHGRTQGAWLGE